MSSIKCPNCGLTNFSFQTECKRCKQFLNATPAPTFQHSAPQDFRPQFAPQHFSPPQPQPQSYLPQVCIKCGTSHQLYLQKFKKTYTPPLAYLGFLLGGILPLLIVLMICRKDHHINAAFCGECWGRFRYAYVFSLLFGLGCLFTLTAAIFAGVILQSGMVAFAGVSLAIAIAAWGGYYDKKISPKFKKITRRTAVIEIPNVGEIDFAPSGVLIQSR